MCDQDSYKEYKTLLKLRNLLKGLLHHVKTLPTTAGLQAYHTLKKTPHSNQTLCTPWHLTSTQLFFSPSGNTKRE